MARYFFHLANGDHRTEDEEGRDLHDVEAARRAATSEARAIMAADLLSGALDLSPSIHVVHEGLGHVFTLRFRDAVDLTDPGP